MADTLDGLQAGMFLVDASGRLVHANASGRAMLSEGNVLHANGKLVALDAKSDDALRDILLGAGSGEAALGGKGVTVHLTARDGEQYVTHVLPLTSGARRRAGQSYAAVAAVFVQKAGHDASPALEMLAQQFELTPAEVRVLDRHHGSRRRRRGRARAQTVARDGAHASAPCVREDRRAAAGRPGQADDELSRADPGARRDQRRGAAINVPSSQFVPTPASRKILP